MASDLLALLDTLDGLHRAAGPGAWRMDPTGTSHQRAIRDASAEAVAICYCGKAHAVDIAKGITALHNAYPRLTAALRAVLTPATEGEREAIVAWLRGPCNDPLHDDRWCSTCQARSDYALAIENGAHRPAPRMSP